MTEQELSQRLGLELKHLRSIKEILVCNLSSDFDVHAFGSRTTGSAKQFSDLDLCITGSTLSFSQMTKIKDDFSESDLPIFVDIIQVKDISDSFKQIIEKDFIKIPF
ncbi:nucleotidyltransferase family protein [Neptuniibacter sp.]|uniref:nucleotidyltransferase family protein n=1 Tax=Neptuniibacter sp. TaxID=1962643 RepID=UPI00262CB8DA|nr:nucleotidyltransferase domain-containing protein [Neptuniibacter sp.]MCP4597485.1 nucleotidyltransferase domain-containing protein [Neptuniibacter sp.]